MSITKPKIMPDMSEITELGEYLIKKLIELDKLPPDAVFRGFKLSDFSISIYYDFITPDWNVEIRDGILSIVPEIKRLSEDLFSINDSLNVRFKYKIEDRCSPDDQTIIRKISLDPGLVEGLRKKYE